ncbi:MAG: hypothetical protein AUJ49_07045 [Desulfovibrionaceae bacterium CG1_02_65_16]|nr:MAG: hypothetical protein AUJ49_07045 [Desulfovibrionaceae bacterium CG1_02_65_16]
MYVVPAQTSVRENPEDTALQVRVLKAGQRVRADFFEDGWAAVFDLKETKRSELRALGYVRVTDLTGGRAVPEEPREDSVEVRKSAHGLKREPKAVEPKADESRAVAASEKSGRAGKRGRIEAKAVSKAELAANDAKLEPRDKALKPGKSAKSDKAAKSEKSGKAGKGFGEVLVADRTLSVRAERDKEATLRKVLRAGQKVRVDFVENGWAAVFDPEEKTREESRAWGYCYAKFLVPQAGYDAAQTEPSSPQASSGHAAASTPDAALAKAGKKGKDAEEAVGYTVLERKADRRAKPPVTVLRARLNLARPPAREAMRKIAREIWKTERRKNEILQLELLLARMDPHGLAYAVVKFHDDGRISEFWWRDVVLEDGGK